jgi:hypothetical protein
MINVHSLFFFDISFVITMIVIAYLSKRLGEALKIKSFYKLLYITSFLVVCASGLDAVSGAFGTIDKSNATLFISMILRLLSGITAFFVCLRYWSWIFPEFFKG